MRLFINEGVKKKKKLSPYDDLTKGDLIKVLLMRDTEVASLRYELSEMRKTKGYLVQ